MEIIIYTLNSFGGNYDYALQLFETYGKHPAVNRCELLLPSNSPAGQQDGIRKVLLSDIAPFDGRFLKKLYFLYRSLINPFRLYKILKRRPGTIAIFNDFDQLTAPIWSWFFRRIRNEHVFAIILHDPDRDHYLPSVRMSSFTMEKVMSAMNIAFYHGYLPAKNYYTQSVLTVAVPHGVYPAAAADKDFLEEIRSRKGDRSMLGILGNIRDEKNYLLVLESMLHLTGYCLLVAGSVANQQVPVDSYKNFIREKKLEDRVIWIERYLSPAELSAAIMACDIIVMYYKSSFSSQSGMLNMIAPFHKNIIISDTESSLKEVVESFKLGSVIKADSLQHFIEGVKLAVNNNESIAGKWEEYNEAVSWHHHVTKATSSFQLVKTKSE